MTKQIQENKINIVDYFNTDVKAFSLYDCVRSIPSGIDGFKPAMRKIIFGMQKAFKNEEVKVSIAASGIQSVSHYHHGSLEGTIVNMAQNFVGSNNVPFLEAIGQFGSRISPESAASRYIFTKLTPAFDTIFSKLDNDILTYHVDDGESIEPVYYLPIIPTILVNGSNGMGTGFACNIMNYNPVDIIDAVKSILVDGYKNTKLVPWYKGFKGKIECNGNQIVTYGIIEKVSSTKLKITELPIGYYTTKYREVLNTLEDAGTIKSYSDNSNEEQIEFVISTTRDIASLPTDELLKLFKLVSRDTENFTVWTDQNKIKKFKSADELLVWFVQFRLTKYDDRKANILNKLSSEIKVLQEKIQFIKFYIDNVSTIKQLSKNELIDLLKANSFVEIESLINIRMYSITVDQIKLFEDSVADLMKDVLYYEKSSAKDLYLKDLALLRKQLN